MTYFKACEIASDIGYLVVAPDGPSNGRMLVPVVNDAEDDFDVVYPENGRLASMTQETLESTEWEICKRP